MGLVFSTKLQETGLGYFYIIVDYNMSVPLDTKEKVQILFNKSFGLLTTDPTSDMGNQIQTNASDKIIPASTIYTQTIPLIAPTIEDLEVDDTFIRPIYPTGSIDMNTYDATPLQCRRLKSKTYPYIVKYENLQVINYLPERTYNGYVNFGDERGVQNLLAQTIPFNFDSAGSYGVSVC